MNITKKMWNEALNHLQFMKREAINIGLAGIFYIQGCNQLEKRYDSGERTKKLYDEIINLH